MADDEYIYDDRTGEFKKKENSIYSNSTDKRTNNPPPRPSNSNDNGCLGCIGGFIVLILENWWLFLIVAIISMCSK